MTDVIFRDEENVKVGSGPVWMLHDIYLVRRFGHDRLWIGLLGIDPDGRLLGVHTIGPEQIDVYTAFIGLDHDDPLGYLHELACEIEAEGVRRLDTFLGSFASCYAPISIGSGRMTIAGTNLQERIEQTERSFRWLAQQ